MKSGKILLGLVAGAAAGAIAGVLFAPEKGSVTRNTISRKSNEYAGQLGNQVKGFIEGVTDKFGAMSEQASKVAETGAAKLHQASDMLDGGHKKV